MDTGIYPAADRIVVIGDVHGDLQRLAQCFIRAGLLNHQFQWVAQPPNTIVVQLGDQIDSLSRGAASSWETTPDLAVLTFMDQMDALARQKGGRVISLLGNHELMNVMGDFTYVSDASMRASGGEDQRRRRFRPGGTLAKQLSTRPVLVKIGEMLFCHAGLLYHHIAMAWSSASSDDGTHVIPILNDWMHRYLNYMPFTTPEAERMHKILLDNEGLLWNRHYADASPQNEPERRRSLQKVLGLMKCRAMFVGHTTVSQILALYDRQLWFVDNGLSRAFDTSSGQILEILHNGVPCPENQGIPFRTILV